MIVVQEKKKTFKNLALAGVTKQMYRRKEQQTDMFEDATLFGGVRLDPGNKWVGISKLVPWEIFEERYAERLINLHPGKTAKPARVAIALLIIKQRYTFSDQDTVEEIRENPTFYISWAPRHTPMPYRLTRA